MATRIFREIRAGDMFASPKEATENEVIQGPTRFTSLAWPYTDRAPVSDRRTGSPCESAATKAGTRIIIVHARGGYLSQLTGLITWRYERSTRLVRVCALRHKRAERALRGRNASPKSMSRVPCVFGRERERDLKVQSRAERRQAFCEINFN